MTIRTRLAALVLSLTLAGILAPPALALPREGVRRDDPIVRVIKRLLRTFGISSNSDSLAVPKP